MSDCLQITSVLAQAWLVVVFDLNFINKKSLLYYYLLFTLRICPWYTDTRPPPPPPPSTQHSTDKFSGLCSCWMHFWFRSELNMFGLPDHSSTHNFLQFFFHGVLSSNREPILSVSDEGWIQVSETVGWKRDEIDLFVFLCFLIWLFILIRGLHSG